MYGQNYVFNVTSKLTEALSSSRYQYCVKDDRPLTNTNTETVRPEP